MIHIIKSIADLVGYTKIKIKATQSGKCIWKNIYNHVAQNDIQLESFEDLYQRRANDCKDCNGYESKRNCFYIKKD